MDVAFDGPGIGCGGFTPSSPVPVQQRQFKNLPELTHTCKVTRTSACCTYVSNT